MTFKKYPIANIAGLGFYDVDIIWIHKKEKKAS